MPKPAPRKLEFVGPTDRRNFLARGFALAASLVAGRLRAQSPAPATGNATASPAAPTAAPAEKPAMPTLEQMGKRNAMVHDPSTIIKGQDEYWVFCTSSGLNGGIASWHSKDLVNWERGPRILTDSPQWIWDDVPNNNGGLWAPDIIKYKDDYRLYFAASTGGSRTSGIGLATNPTLDPADPNYKWTDRGLVIRTRDARDFNGQGDNFNAIDPAIIADGDKQWLAFGSFWSGIKLIQLDPATGKRLAPDSTIYSLATNNNRNKDVEASYIYKHGDYYYLFLNWGVCCRGLYSTYKIMVGRSKNITGPYVDKDGVDLAKGGGSLFLGSEGDFIGPGHAGIFEENGKFWFSCHFYDGATPRGTSMLAIRPLHWDTDGWPAIEPKQLYVAENTRVNPNPQRRGGGPGRGLGAAGAAPTNAPAPTSLPASPPTSTPAIAPAPATTPTPATTP